MSMSECSGDTGPQKEMRRVRFARPRSTAQSFFSRAIPHAFRRFLFRRPPLRLLFFSSRPSLLDSNSTRFCAQSSFLIRFTRVRSGDGRFGANKDVKGEEKREKELLVISLFFEGFPSLLFFIFFFIWQQLIAGTSGPVNPKPGANNKHTHTQKFLCGCNKRERVGDESLWSMTLSRIIIPFSLFFFFLLLHIHFFPVVVIG